MLTWSNSTPAGAVSSIGQSQLYVAGSTSGIAAYVMFRPTAMDLSTGVAAGTNNTYIQDSVRTSRTCYMKGFSEKIRIETNTGNPWFHRRICFTSKDPAFYTQNPSDTTGTQNTQVANGALEVNPNGWQRLAANMLLQSLNQTYLVQKGLIFKGAEGVDWDDMITAPLDTTRIDVKFDKTFIYKSGNERGILREHKLYHPMNHNIVYDDDETGKDVTTEITYSVMDKRGMGNYHILDIFSQGASGSTSDRLAMRCNSTLYWHEK